jgi:MoxR-like ATPase
VTGDASWHIYRGNGEQHDGIDRLPKPPPWRRFDGEILPGTDAGAVDVRSPRPGTEQRARSYRPDTSVVDLTNAALYLRRPLLVTGKPGTGKSTLAHSIAWELKLGPVLYWSITSRSHLQDGLYRYDAVGRLQQANLRRLGQDGPPVSETSEFITLGPLGTALVAGPRPRVLLIDEFDKSDIDLPNDLLNVLEEGQFTIPELVREMSDEPVRLVGEDSSTAMVKGGVVRCHAFPIIVITSNGEREFPAAFRRRCLQLVINEPDAAKLAEIVRTQLGDDALRETESLFQDFLNRRDGADLPTDHLLNAVYLAMSGLAPDGETRQRVVDGLFARSRPGEP